MKTNVTYPLAENKDGAIFTASGRKLDAITLDAVLKDELASDDFRIHPETLKMQAEQSHQAGFDKLADNLTRAAELAAVPNPMILDIYNALRPGRSDYPELIRLAEKLEIGFSAIQTGKLIRQAADAYQLRGLLRKTP